MSRGDTALDEIVGALLRQLHDEALAVEVGEQVAVDLEALVGDGDVVVLVLRELDGEVFVGVGDH
ncbi:hypothetical protein AX769_00370 [Frondihabitans sp. PAMC 28766]|uniref:hypothetical protein n=1 Tax=Frondihabitans sp. PAMC 28766 TaxID=1795630 RepID=UPI00078BEABF|nr:hypothetical protein [Frondihabitans sp. PAMC 28766]AMM18875.1 hypothetical protein AX769_00370 [Frondihabitans sp. PAMC 28766]